MEGAIIWKGGAGSEAPFFPAQDIFLVTFCELLGDATVQELLPPPLHHLLFLLAGSTNLIVEEEALLHQLFPSTRLR